MLIQVIMLCLSVNADSGVKELASINGFNPTTRVVKAIENAALVYKIPVKELATIAILETGMGKYVKLNKNKNGSVDVGLFQINTVNKQACIEYNLDNPEGSALCAAKLLNTLRKHYGEGYQYAYHSKTKSVQLIYKTKYDKVFNISKKTYMVNNEN